MQLPRGVGRVLRVICAVALLALLAYGVNWHALPHYLQRLSWGPALLAMCGLGAHFFISPWKWQWALRMHGLEFSLPYLVRANGTGFFLNNFLPSAIGGDAYRAMSTWPSEGYRSRAVAAVVIERVVGFAALIFLGNLGALALVARSPLARVFIACSVGAAAIGLVLVYGMYIGWFKRLTARVRHTKIFAALAHNMEFLRRARLQWIPLIGISLLFQAIAIANVYLLFVSLDAPASLAACALISAVSGLAGVIPLSINGLGIVEGSFAGTAVALGLNYEAALMVAILIRLFVLPPSLVFGLLYVVHGDPILNKRAVSTKTSQ